jgi:hypothetical protein
VSGGTEPVGMPEPEVMGARARLWFTRQQMADYGDARAREADERIVAWLRRLAEDERWSGGGHFAAFTDLADAIALGEHRTGTDA